MPTLLVVQVGLDRVVRESDTSDCERPETSLILDTIVSGNHTETRDLPHHQSMHEGSKWVTRGLSSPTSVRY